jgi:hypothetical protein
MRVRTFVRWVVWVSLWAVALLCARTARAAAPMCDERGLSAIAPTPVLPAKDVKIDAAFPLGCDAPAFNVAPAGPRARGQTAPVADGFEEVWLRPSAPRLPKLFPDQEFAASSLLVPVSAGHGRGVFRPPRR